MGAVPERLLALKESDPEQFRRLMLELKQLALIPHSGQREVLASPARFKVLNCGRRWGKTKLAAHVITKKARQPNKMLWWVAPTYKIVKRGYTEVLKQLPPGVLTHAPPPETNFDAGRSVVLHFKNGTRMEFYSAERPEGMLGEAVDLVVLDEAARMKRAVWEQTIMPTLIDHLGTALLISTPRSRNWFWQVWNKGQDPEQHNWDSWTFTTQDNPTLPPGEADRMAADMPRLEAEQEIFAKFLAAGSSVFTFEDAAVQYDPVLENGMVEGCPPEGYVVLGIDLARTSDYTVLYATRMRDRRNCFFERWQDVLWSEQRRRIRRAVRALKRNGAENVLLMVDEGNAGSVIVEDLEAEGYDVVPINFTTHKSNMVRLLAKDLEEAHAFLLDEGQIDEFHNYTMTMTPAGRMTYSAPEGENDDAVSAKMLAHWGCVNEGFGDVSVITGDERSSTPRPQDPEGFDDFAEDWDDLIDEDGLTEEEAAEAVGYAPARPPTPAELMQQPDLWF
jgi:hypothetical protein